MSDPTVFGRRLSPAFSCIRLLQTTRRRQHPEMLQCVPVAQLSDRVWHIAPRSEPDDGADDLALVQQVERPVDLVQRQHLADHLVDLDLPAKVALHEPGQLRAALYAAKSRAPPDATGDELERAGMYLLARARDADDRRLPPPLVAALERGAHDVHIADAFEGVVDPTVGHVDDDLLNGH